MGYELEDAKAAARALNARCGLKTVKEVLKRFTVRTVLDLDSEQYGDFIRQCSEYDNGVAETRPDETGVESAAKPCPYCKGTGVLDP
jgi:hypothetical protein